MARLHRAATHRRIETLVPVFLLALVLCIGASRDAALALDFTKLTSGAVVTSGGGSRSVNWIDADGDDDLDLYITNGGSPGENNFVYWNEAGVFTADTVATIANDGLRAVGSTWGDVDNDGEADLFVTSWYFEKNAFYINEGAGVFTRVISGHPAFPVVLNSTFSESASWVDADNDGDLDLFVANSGNAGPQINFFWENNGDGSFTRRTDLGPVAVARYARHGAWCDFDLDGDADLFVANESGENELYVNQLVETGVLELAAAGSSPVTAASAVSFGGSWGDYDGDGDFDLFVANQNGDNELYRNHVVETGTATFEAVDNVVTNDGGNSVAGLWGDLDNDGDLDLFVTNGYHVDGVTQFSNYVYENDGAGGFTKVASGDLVSDVGWSYGAAAADPDDDGDLDLVVANWFGNDQDNAFYQNDAETTGRHWLVLQLEGSSANRSAIGARVSVKATIGGTPSWQHRFVSSQESYCGQSLRVHVGLGDATLADSVIVRWPGGEDQVLVDVAVDQRLHVMQPTAASVEPEIPGGPGSKPGDTGGTDSGDAGGSDDDSSTPGAKGPGAALLGLRAAPNPFVDQTSLSFRLPHSARVRIHVRDASGRTVHGGAWTEWSSGPGRIEWDGRTRTGEGAPAGIYFVTLETEFREPDADGSALGGSGDGVQTEATYRLWAARRVIRLR